MDSDYGAFWAPQSTHEKYLAKKKQRVSPPLPLLSSSSQRKNSVSRFSRVGGSFGSGGENSRSHLIGRTTASTVSDDIIPTIYANSMNDLQNLGNTFFSKAVMNKVPLKNRASYIPPTTTNKLLFSGDNPGNPAQSSILNSYVNDMTPYALPDFRAIPHERPSINDRAAVPFVRPFRSGEIQRRQRVTPFVRPFRKYTQQRNGSGNNGGSAMLSNLATSKSKRNLAADSILSQARPPLVNNIQPLAPSAPLFLGAYTDKLSVALPAVGSKTMMPTHVRPTRNIFSNQMASSSSSSSSAMDSAAAQKQMHSKTNFVMYSNENDSYQTDCSSNSNHNNNIAAASSSCYDANNYADYDDDDYDVDYYNYYLPRGGILGFLGGLLGGFDEPTTTNTSISYTTSVVDSQKFSTSIESLNQTINQYILSQVTSTSSEIANMANINIVNLSGEDVNINISNQQNITYLNISKLNVTSVNQFVLQQSTTIFDSILSAFQNENTSSLTSLASSSNNSNLIQSILNTNPSSGNINNVITSSTTVQTAFSNEKSAVYKNLASNSTVQNFAQNFSSSLQNALNLNLSNVSASKTLSVLVANTQSISSTLNIITKLDLCSSTFNTINTSDTFKIDKSVTNVTSTVAKTDTTQTETSESVGSAINSVGNAIGSAVSGITWSVAGPFLAGAAILVVLVLGGGALFAFNKQKKQPRLAEFQTTI